MRLFAGNLADRVVAMEAAREERMGLSAEMTLGPLRTAVD